MKSKAIFLDLKDLSVGPLTLILQTETRRMHHKHEQQSIRVKLLYAKQTIESLPRPPKMLNSQAHQITVIILNNL